MKAVRFHETGSIDVLRWEDVPDPSPAADEVIVRVRAAALNRLDVSLRSGSATMPGLRLPHIGGFDIAGEIEAVGAEVDAARVGEAVIVKARVTGPRSTGRLDIIGIARPGGFAEWVAVPAHCVVAKPANYSFEEAAAFGCVYLTAWYGLIDRAALRPGEVVLVHAGGGGAGTAAIQVAKAAGATVVTTVGSDEKCVMARERLGADHAVNYHRDDLLKVIRDTTDGRGVDVVFDPVWGDSASQTLDALASRGRWIVLGMVGGLHASLDASKILFREITLRGIVEFFADDAQFDGVLNLARQGWVRPIIARSWPLAQLADAQRQMEEARAFGKIVVTP
ncbi:MAG: zinc-binding alcohol dehydrogenase family protein [Phycisphaerae bacterium]